MARGWNLRAPHHPVKPFEERLWDMIAGPWVAGVAWDDCWRFTGSWRSRQGYGRVQLAGRGSRSTQAHVAAFEQVWGRLHPGDIVRHACAVTACCNPFHLAPGSRVENRVDEWDAEFAWACTALGQPPRWAVAS